MEGLLVLWLLFGAWGAVVANDRTGEPVGGFLIAFLLGPIGVLICYLKKPDAKTLEKKQLANGGRKCPHCAEIVKPEAVVCRYCNRDLPALYANK